jgi:hypothetical protein
MAEPPQAELASNPVARSLVAFGAPLAGVQPLEQMSLEDAVVGALRIAHVESAILRSLPVVVAKNAPQLDLASLEARAREQDELATLGLVAELAGRFARNEALLAWAERLPHPAEGRFFFPPRNTFDRQLAQLQTPEFARRWGFWMNLGEDAFRSVFNAHGR